MKFVQESLISSAVRSFAVAFCALLGLCASLFVIMLFVGGMVGGERIVEPKFDLHVEPGPDGKTEQLSSDVPVILQLDIAGVIGAGRLTRGHVERALDASRVGPLKGERVKAVFLFVNTPGGTVFDGDGIYRALLAYKERYKVPVYAFVDGLCASGGMYVACAADKIFASDVSLVGSVGVISEFFNVADLLGKVGVNALTVISGKYKDDLNPVRPWKPDEEQRWKAISDYYYGTFTDIVAKARPKLTKDLLINQYGAQIFPAPLALQYGYIDAAGASRKEALQALAKMAKIEGDYQVFSVHEDQLLDALFGPNNALLKGQITHKIEGMPAPELANKPLYLFVP